MYCYVISVSEYEFMSHSREEFYFAFRNKQQAESLYKFGEFLSSKLRINVGIHIEEIELPQENTKEILIFSENVSDWNFSHAAFYAFANTEENRKKFDEFKKEHLREDSEKNVHMDVETIQNTLTHEQIKSFFEGTGHNIEELKMLWRAYKNGQLFEKDNYYKYRHSCAQDLIQYYHTSPDKDLVNY